MGVAGAAGGVTVVAAEPPFRPCNRRPRYARKNCWPTKTTGRYRMSLASNSRWNLYRYSQRDYTLTWLCDNPVEFKLGPERAPLGGVPVLVKIESNQPRIEGVGDT